VAAAVAAAGLGVGVAGPGIAAPAPAAYPDLQAARVTIDTITPYVDAATTEVEVAGTVVNTGTVAITGEINLRLAHEPFADGEEVAAWQQAGVEAYPAWTVAAHVLEAPLAPGATLPFRFAIPTATFGFEAVPTFTWGPLGVVVDLATSARSVAAARSFLLYAPADAIGTPLELSIAWPLTARAGESAADAATRAAQVVAATADTRVDWLVDPRLLAGDGEAGAAGTALADQVADGASRRSVFALPWGDPDVSVLAHGSSKGAGSLFALARSLGRATVKATLGAAAASVRHDLVWPLDPVDAELVTMVQRAGSEFRIASQPAPVATLPTPSTDAGWLLSGATDWPTALVPPAAVEALTGTDAPSGSERPTDSGSRVSADATPQLSADAASQPSADPRSQPSPSLTRALTLGRVASPSPTDPGRLTAWPRTIRLAAGQATGHGIVPDADLTAALDGGASGATEAVATQYAAALLALRVQAFHAGSARAGAVVIIPRASTADPALLARRADHVLTLPWIKPARLGTVVDESEGPVIRVDPGDEPTRGPDADVLDDLNAAAHEVNAFAKLTDDPSAITAEWSPRLLAPVAGSLIPAAARTSGAARVTREAVELVGSVGTVEGSQVTMISATSELPVVIANTSTLPVTLTVSLRTSKPALVADKQVTVELLPDTRSTVRIPVHAIASGDVDVTVHLLNPDGEDVGAASTFRVRVRAEWENIGTGMILGAVAVLFVFGLIRSIRRRRAGRQATTGRGRRRARGPDGGSDGGTAGEPNPGRSP
jgi:hypothetical protein